MRNSNGPPRGPVARCSGALALSQLIAAPIANLEHRISLRFYFPLEFIAASSSQPSGLNPEKALIQNFHFEFSPNL